MNAPLLTRETRWSCPLCQVTDITFDPRPHSRMHNCRGLAGLSFPLVEDGTDCKIEAHERDDFIAGELVQTDANGRPVMNVTTTRADGSNDVTVYAPTATGTSKETQP